MSSDNSKVTEGTGEIPRDSLAGESISSGGAFATKNPNAHASGQKAAGTTANNTDTSGATILQPAPDAEARLATEEWSETGALNASASLGASGGKPYDTTAGGPQESFGGNAPNYVNPVSGAAKPHGQNISEGGFDGDAPNASFTTNIGGKNDPGRAALQGLQNENAAAGGGGDVGVQRETGVSNDGQFDSLGDTNA